MNKIKTFIKEISTTLVKARFSYCHFNFSPLNIMRVELLLLALLAILPSTAGEAGHSAEDELAGTCGR